MIFASARDEAIRQRFLRLLAVLGLIATVVAMQPHTSSAHAGGSDPYAIAEAVDGNPDPRIFETSIVAHIVTRDIGGGVMADMWTYGGTVPGPQIKVDVGDTVIVHFRNELPLAIGIHWHGIELSNAGDGTQLTQNGVPTGGSFLYKFTVPRPGIFWYHPHHSPTNPTFKGMYGSLLVADPHDDTLVANGVLPGADKTRTLVFSDTIVCKDPGQNDDDTYEDSMPWAGGGTLPEQGSPTPADVCDRPLDEHGQPIRDANGRPIPLRKGQIPNIQRTPMAGKTNEGQTVLANGRNAGARAGTPEAPAAVAEGSRIVDIPAGSGLRLLTINAATIRFARLRLTDSAGNRIPLVRVGGEAGLLDQARIEGGHLGGAAPVPPLQFNTEYERGEIVLVPSDRADLVVAVPVGTPLGVATLWTLDYTRTGIGYSYIPTVPVMHLNITEATSAPYTITEGTPLRTHPAVADPVEALGPRPGILPGSGGTFSPLLDPATFSPAKPGSAAEEIKFATDGLAPTIDGVRGAHGTTTDYRAEPHTVTSRYAKLGDTVELTITNTTPAHHAFHLHGFSFQPVAFEKFFASTTPGGNPNMPEGNYVFDYNEFVDTIDVPGHYTLRFRVRLDDRPLMDGTTPGGGMGRWVLHCHIFFHASMGMHAELVVVAPDGNETPYVNSDITSVTVPQGGAASMTGTFADPDGDAVTLRASEGSVTDVGGGRWSWASPPNAGAAGRRTVHVTATDSRGLRNQVAFDMVVENAPPAVTVVSPASGSAFAAGSAITVVATVSDPGGDEVACRFDWDDGTGAGPAVAPVGGQCTESKAIPAAGVHNVVVSASDSAGATASDSTVIVVYDPAAGGITGKGTTTSPPGAFPADPTATGLATFDFEAAYQPGTTVPTGKVKFGVLLPQFDLRGEAYGWLVVADDKAQLRGTAKVNGAGGYSFLLTVADGSVDRLRLQVWNPTGGIVYDNMPGAPDDLDTTVPPPITSGSIVVG